LILLFAKSKPTLGPTKSTVLTSRQYLVRSKYPGREAGHLPPSRAEVGTSGDTDPIPIYICGVQFRRSTQTILIIYFKPIPLLQGRFKTVIFLKIFIEQNCLISHKISEILHERS
jgi:hypothetical protein